MPEMKFVAIEGITLHYILEGLQEAVPLVFINSLGSDLRIWDNLVPYFAEHFPVIRYDKRGHGLSDCPPGPYSIRDHANDLANLLEHLQVKQAILVGVSVGGMIALDYALNHPQRAGALVLCDTAAKLGAAEYWHERIESLGKHGFDQVAAGIVSRWLSPTFIKQNPADYQGYFNMLTRTPIAGYIATCEAIRDTDLRDLVGKIEAKSLVLCGAEDAATPPDLVRELAETLPQARFELIDNAGHLPSIEQPAAMATKMKRFLQENGYVRSEI
jgi:3-oxoadipate enol-lactonase